MQGIPLLGDDALLFLEDCEVFTKGQTQVIADIAFGNLVVEHGVGIPDDAGGQV